MICGDARMGLPEILEWACRIPMVVVAPEYRLAPEHPHPAPVEDCYASLVWTAEHGSELGSDSSRLIVQGGSAGGGLSAGTVLLARDRGGPPVCAQILMCPMIDDRNDTVSARQMAGVGVLDRASNEAAWTALLGDRRGSNDVSPYAAPARASDLSGLPPTFIDVGSAETFRDEAVAYASKIWAAGGNCELHVWAGGCHGFHSIAPDAAVSKAALHARFEWLHRLLGHLS
jgi:acetyl esterase/lipase